MFCDKAWRLVIRVGSVDKLISTKNQARDLAALQNLKEKGFFLECLDVRYLLA
jgi:hypothetical protein